MQLSILLRAVPISLVIAALAVFIQPGESAGLLAAPNIQFFLTIAAAILAGILLMQWPGRIRIARIATESREQGTVKWFNVKKGYGFITRDQGDDIFVHFRNIKDSNRRAMAEGKRVEFLVINGDKGLQADEVSSLD